MKRQLNTKIDIPLGIPKEPVPFPIWLLSLNENVSPEEMECRVAERDNKEHSAKGFIVKLLSNSSVSLINDFCTNTKLEMEEELTVVILIIGVQIQAALMMVLP